jgi:hypothetical protein
LSWPWLPKLAKQFSAFQKERAEIGAITHHRWRVKGFSHLHAAQPLCRKHPDQPARAGPLDRLPYLAPQERPRPFGRRVSDGTIRDEMPTLRFVMRFAASKRYIRDSQVFSGKLPVGHAARNSRPTNTLAALSPAAG